jgi:hypothetical protein
MPRWGQGGEIVGWDGTSLIISEPLEWVNGEPHFIALRCPDGSLSGPYPVIPGEAEDEIVAEAHASFQFYNKKRPHMGLKNQTPDQVYFDNQTMAVAA